jgi:hypothetical protein
MAIEWDYNEWSNRWVTTWKAFIPMLKLNGREGSWDFIVKISRCAVGEVVVAKSYRSYNQRIPDKNIKITKLMRERANNLVGLMDEKIRAEAMESEIKKLNEVV